MNGISAELQARFETEMNLFKRSHDAAHLQEAGDALYRALYAAHGELFATVAFQAGGWPRPWEQGFNQAPPQGSRAEHNVILFDMLTDIGSAVRPWESIPKRDMITSIDLILIRRNRRNSPFVNFGHPVATLHWPHDAVY